MYYEKIKEILGSYENGFARQAEKTFEFQAGICQRFCYYQHIYEHVKKVQQALVQYRDSSSLLTKDSSKESEERLSLPEKLYIELLWKLYVSFENESVAEAKRKKNFVDTYVLSPKYVENVEHFWKVNIQGKEGLPNYSDELKKYIINALTNWASNYNNWNLTLDALNLDKMKECMKVIEEADSIPMPTKSDSMEELLSKQVLDSYLDFLENENLPGFYFQMAPVTRAITTGKIASGYPKYIKREYKYNLKKLHPYIEEIKYLKNTYEDTLEDIQPFESIWAKEEKPKM